MKRIRNYFVQMLNGIIIAGIIIFFLGLYYWVIKAGIPYQDPPLELRIQYAINTGIGDLLVANGFKIMLLGGVIRLLFAFISRKHQKNRSDLMR